MVCERTEGARGALGWGEGTSSEDRDVWGTASKGDI